MYPDDVENSVLASAERRGVWTVVLAWEDCFSATCITDDAIHLLDKGRVGSVGRATGGDRVPGTLRSMAARRGTAERLARGRRGRRDLPGRHHAKDPPGLLKNSRGGRTAGRDQWPWRA